MTARRAAGWAAAKGSYPVSVSSAASLPGPAWYEAFDADLPKVVPAARAAVGAAGLVELQTYSHATNGRINCPAAWWTEHGLTAFFATHDYGPPAPGGYWPGSKDLVDCTFWEVVRDEWIHSCSVVVNGVLVWRPPNRLMEQLMFDVRGWTVLDDLRRTEIQRNVRASLTAAAERLQAVVA